ncbi:serine/threonine-protein phosphatase [Arthrobacter echini]|uniref:Serine/threonine-protein phosphatase n=1 Tax=Arthrobacter echini TaxID=1529066 RepID=A0A5D0XRI6_9MICC|nr:PP2C family serine/threonine-protein phosphatase [Arthrobacter echini]TYC99019.1 serine/threonine-protein phosphatase [Arthrobacter echini]
MRERQVHGAHAIDITPAALAPDPGGSSAPPAEDGGNQASGTSPLSGGDVRLTYGFGTDVGLLRELNEDSFIAVEPVFAIADGMGGHEAGEVASSICVRTLEASDIAGTGYARVSVGDLEDLIERADHAIRDEAGGDAGTTLTGVVLVEESTMPHWLFFNVGDSRVYRLSNDTFGQITVDHSEVQELVDTGQLTEEQARTHPRRHVVTRALGAGDDTEADFWLLPVEQGDRLLLCSDGLSGEVTDEEICGILSLAGDPQDACNELITAALGAGARDNVTVIVVDATFGGMTGSGAPAAPVRGFFAADGVGSDG